MFSWYCDNKGNYYKKEKKERKKERRKGIRQVDNTIKYLECLKQNKQMHQKTKKDKFKAKEKKNPFNLLFVKSIFLILHAFVSFK